ncbi:MAG TPA: glucose-6-phosphate dehydrogenase [Caulobacteraceae bacterium]|jgi:glucose-6-phosphate 1-dehydrogenase|nr:glucose-6-phosphate dehydrogenase [Caulobacteraceae bacterium]
MMAETTRPIERLVIFGATGDLAARMLLPSLWFLDEEGLLAPAMKIIGSARTEMSREAYVARVREEVASKTDSIDETSWARFSARLDYRAADVTRPEGLDGVVEAVGDAAAVFYLALSPSLYGALCRALDARGLACSDCRIVLEKPLGKDLASSRAINEAVASVFAESRVFRIDHYLGKETVQNLVALRFANTLFEPLWNNLAIDHVQITIAETDGVGDRWGYYDEYGALRDMVQNHMLQLLTLVAMEPPADAGADSVRDEKVKVLKSLRPFTTATAQAASVRGQYRGGVVGGKSAKAYLEETGRPTDTETFVALRVDIDNWRWAGVPFFLRTGKRLPDRRTQIVVQFKPLPHSIFGDRSRDDIVANRLVIELQPDEDISLLLMNRRPGLAPRLQAMPLSLALGGDGRRRIAYERLFLDVLAGNPSLFVRRDEVELAWAWIDGVAGAWNELGAPPRAYAAGSWGPPGAFALLERTGREWLDE